MKTIASYVGIVLASIVGLVLVYVFGKKPAVKAYDYCAEKLQKQQDENDAYMIARASAKAAKAAKK
jgi:hypothetical protein